MSDVDGGCSLRTLTRLRVDGGRWKVEGGPVDEDADVFDRYVEEGGGEVWGMGAPIVVLSV